MDALRSLDPAADPVDPNGPRARTDLARILATDPGVPPQPDKRRPALGRIAVVAAAVVAIGSGVVALPSLVGGDEAFASWTAEPKEVGPDERADMAAACRDSSRGREAAAQFSRSLASATTAIAERRGAWSLVLLAGRDGFTALCITNESRPLFRTGFGSMGTPSGYAEPAPRSLAATSLGVGAIDDNHLSVAVGPAGADVTAVTYVSAAHGRVAATVSGGYFAFWLPGDELEDASKRGVPVEVSYRDGSTGSVILRFL